MRFKGASKLGAEKALGTFLDLVNAVVKSRGPPEISLAPSIFDHFVFYRAVLGLGTRARIAILV